MAIFKKVIEITHEGQLYLWAVCFPQYFMSLVVIDHSPSTYISYAFFPPPLFTPRRSAESLEKTGSVSQKLRIYHALLCCGNWTVPFLMSKHSNETLCGPQNVC